MSELLVQERFIQNQPAGLNDDAKRLIEKFENELQQKLNIETFRSTYSSIDDILETKYKLKNIDDIEAPNYACKTEFITKGVRGNLQKANGNVLTYEDADDIIEDAIDEELP
jgi:hypothetical protein